MENIFSYRIDSSQMLQYEQVIEKEKMRYIESTNEIVASSRIYFICKIRKPGIISKIFSNSSRFPEVLYVGETFNKPSRYERHEKLLKATALKNGFEDLRVYFIRIGYTFCGSPVWVNSPVEVMNELKDLYSKTAIQLLERLFIRIFDPILNKESIDKKIHEDNLVNQKLVANGIRYVHLNIGMNEDEYKFWSPNLHSKSDWHYFDLKTGEMHEGMPNLFESA